MNALYGIKFIGFIFIFFHHLAFPYSLGSTFTTFFFVFAGFITGYNFIKKDFQPNKKNVLNFYLNKFIKNWPIYIFTLLISIPFVTRVSGFDLTIKDFFTHLFMLQTIIPQGNKTFMFNGLSWFLVDLMIFYLLIPLLYKLIKKYKLDSVIKSIISIIILISLEIIFSLIFKDGPIAAYSFKWWILYISPISRILNILIGFMVGIIFEKNKDWFNKKINKIPNFIILLIEFLALISIYVRYKTSNLLPGSFMTNGTYDLPMSLILIIVFAIGRGKISKILGSKPLVYLGKLSLPCYMLHQLMINYLVLCCFSNPWYRQEISFTRNLFDGLFILVLVICVSIIFFEYILNPCTNILIKKFERGKRKRYEK